MATKTSSKTAARKLAARRPVAAHKPVATKAKVSKRKVEADTESHARAAAPAQTRAQQPVSAKGAPQTAPTLRHEVESVSLIDKKKARKKAEEGEGKSKRQVLPPISRIRASLETPVAPSKAIAPAKPQPAPTERPNIIVDGTTAPPTGVAPPTETEI